MSLQSFLDTVKTDVETWAVDAEHFIEHEAEKAWAAVKPVLTALPAETWAALKPLAAEAIAELKGGTASVESIGATLLNKAEAVGLAELETLPEKLFQAVVSALIAAV